MPSTLETPAPIQHPGEEKSNSLRERLAANDGLAGGVDVQLLDPALELRRDRVLAAFADLDRADGANDPRRNSGLALGY